MHEDHERRLRELRALIDEGDRALSEGRVIVVEKAADLARDIKATFLKKQHQAPS